MTHEDARTSQWSGRCHVSGTLARLMHRYIDRGGVVASLIYSIAVDHMVADDDNVAFAYTLTGTHQGPFMGHEATGKPISIRGMQISRFENGKMVERWGMSDQMGILQQIGAVEA
ncbi:MAG: ester cyclase [Thermomicrobiales bacterium]